MNRIDEILRHFDGVRSAGGDEWMAKCPVPAHADHDGSLHISVKDGKVLLKCFGGCDTASIVEAAGLKMSQLFNVRGDERPVGGGEPFQYGCTLAEYAEAKRLPVEYLQSIGLRDAQRPNKAGTRLWPGVQFPYFDERGADPQIRWRMCMKKGGVGGDRRFVWERGSKMRLYGLQRQPQDKAWVILVEGESDWQTLDYNGFPVLALPGATNYRPERDDPILAQYGQIFVHIEPDHGGFDVFTRFAGGWQGREPSALLPKMRFWSTPGAEGEKDPSALWCRMHGDPQAFRDAIDKALWAAETAAVFRERPMWREIADKAGAETAPPAMPNDALTAPEGRPDAPKSPADPAAAAAAWAASQTTNGEYTLRFWRNGWYRHNGFCYQPVPDADIEGEAVAWLKANGPAYRLRPKVTDMNNLLLNARAHDLLGLPVEMPAPAWIGARQPAPGLLAVANGILDVEAAARATIAAWEQGRAVAPEEAAAFLRPPTPDLLAVNALPYVYDPAARCPKFMDWLVTTLPEPDKAEQFQMLLGLLLVPDTTFQVVVFLYGDGGTGKSSALTITGAYLGGPANWCSIDLLTLADKFEYGDLAEKLANLVEEMPTDDPQNRIRYIEGKFKATITGAVMQFCRKGKAPVSGRCTARHVFAVNNLPKFFDKSEGVWDRTRVIPFRVRFRDTPDQIRAVENEIIRNELPGVLNFGLAGLAKLRRLGRFPECADGLAVKNAHRASCDIDRQYCLDHFEAAPGEDTECRMAYKDFCAFCEENGLARRSAPTFHAAMLRLFGVEPMCRSHTDHTRVYKNIRPTYKPEPATLNPEEIP